MNILVFIAEVLAKIWDFITHLGEVVPHLFWRVAFAVFGKTMDIFTDIIEHFPVPDVLANFSLPVPPGVSSVFIATGIPLAVEILISCYIIKFFLRLCFKAFR